MQLSIDTSKDSHEDIRRAIQLLQSVVSGGAAVSSRNIFDNPMPGESAPAPIESSPSLFGMFDSSPTTSVPVAAVASSVIETEAADEHPQIELY